MPVEIRELIIRAVTTTEPNQPAKGLRQKVDPDLERDALIQDCVKQVLCVLKKTEER